MPCWCSRQGLCGAPALPVLRLLCGMSGLSACRAAQGLAAASLASCSACATGRGKAGAHVCWRTGSLLTGVTACPACCATAAFKRQWIGRLRASYLHSAEQAHRLASSVTIAETVNHYSLPPRPLFGHLPPGRNASDSRLGKLARVASESTRLHGMRAGTQCSPDRCLRCRTCSS